MTAERRAALQNIKSFPSLVRYLRDEMDWPIATDDFEDLTFEYSPEELGIDSSNAAKIEEIKRLRPLATDQPWGIFFVKFEPKRLPVVALRRILSQVALRKRASANRAERAAWAIEDLLFVSSYGEGAARQISFAHFREDREGNLPALHVLGWDAQDTGLHIDYIADTLSTQLRWPNDEGELDEWRERWRSAFTVRHREVITTSQLLAERLAELAREIRARVNAAVEIETESGRLRTLMKAFQEALLHDLDKAGFADMYAQTVAYGLLSARVSRESGALVADDAAALIPVTNPFLREMLESFIHAGDEAGTAERGLLDFDEVGINEIVETLRHTNMEAVLRDFGDKNPDEDPVIHFYEDFLREYDRHQKVSRGVFYTPRPIVSYIVRSVDQLLRTEFGLADGLADTTTWAEMVESHTDLKIPEGVAPDQDFVQVLDPATGTGTFLVEVIEVIHHTVVAKWSGEGCSGSEIDRRWNEYVPRHLLTRLHGYELLMAPYAIAHLKIGLKLRETGYRFGDQERARVYLTNALEPPQDFTGQFETMSPALAHEASAVNRVKRRHCFTVVLGNPPYSGVSFNMSTYAQGLVEPYKMVDGVPLGERKVWLQDDYVKFMRLAQTVVEQSGVGVLGYVTNHGYLDNPTFRGMRQSLTATFDRLDVLDLHGSSIKQEGTHGDSLHDRNVFDIQQGVAVCIASRHQQEPRVVRHAELWGSREDKYRTLSEHGDGPNFVQIYPASPYYLLEPHSSDFHEEYQSAWKITDVMPFNSAGYISARDAFVIDLDGDRLLQRIADLTSTEASDDEIRSRYFAGRGSPKYPAGDTRGWKLASARARLRGVADLTALVRETQYRPFDTRWVFWDGGMIDWPRPELNRHMLTSGDSALVLCRQCGPDGWRHILVGRGLIESCFVSNRTREVGYVFPMSAPTQRRSLFDGEASVGNFSQEFLEAIAAAADEAIDLSPGALSAFIYAVLHSPTYRSRYSEFLKLDFPRIPLPAGGAIYSRLVRAGTELLSLHLLEASVLASPASSYIGGGRPEVARVGWADEVVWIDTPKTDARSGHRAVSPGTHGFEGVPEHVWDFQIGGYQVLHKWLKDRAGRSLTADDITHYQRIVVAISETIRLMGEIDEAIDEYGGWPEAFLTSAARIETIS